MKKLARGLPLGRVNLSLGARHVHGVWKAGGLDMVFPGEVLGLTSARLGQMLPGVGLVEIHMSARLPPVLSPGTDGVGVLTLGDLQLTVVPTGEPITNAVLDAAVTVVGDLRLVPEGHALSPVFENARAFTTVDAPEVLSTEVSDGLTALLTELTQSKLPELMSMMFVFPLDMLEGYTFDDPVVVGNGDGMFVVEGDLNPAD